MGINEQKTQLLCVSPAINYEVGSYLCAGRNTIKSSETLKILGFTIDNKCSLNAHIATLKNKFARRVWIVRHLKRAGLEQTKLVRVYCAFIRPCFEYLGPTMCGMMNKTQAQTLECMQSIALKTIFGWERSYNDCLELAGIQTLNERRLQACSKFANKTLTNPRFAHWFPLNQGSTYNTRHQEKYHIDFAKQERLRNAPLHFMRRLLNDQVQQEDVDFDELDRR